PTFTSDGDETVFTPSATAVEGKTYYLDIEKYNRGGNTNRSHRNIMEVISINKFIKDIITSNTIILPDYITSEKPESSSADNKLRLSIHSPVSIDIYDNLGNHTGIIPNPNPDSDLELVEENIPNSYYMNFGEGKYVGFDSGSQNRVELNGTGVGTFTLKIGEYSGDIEATSTTFIDIPVTSAMKGELNIQNLDTLPQLKIDVEGDGIFDFEVKPSEEFDSILFLEIMKKTIMSFGLDNGTETSLMNRIDNLIKTIKKGKIEQTGKKIKGFISSIKPIKGHHNKISMEEKQAILNMLNQLLINIK
ncbi:MAG: Parallel beta-helix repeat protein, partial [Parcubacteria group bacterium]|nr:Parallel beta-helix repeat protein [Parcubacteria group bacterium]